MNKVLLILSLVLVASCGPAQQEKEKIAAVTCSIMSETRNMDDAFRFSRLNNTRVEIGGWMLWAPMLLSPNRWSAGYV